MGFKSTSPTKTLEIILFLSLVLQSFLAHQYVPCRGKSNRRLCLDKTPSSHQEHCEQRPPLVCSTSGETSPATLFPNNAHLPINLSPRQPRRGRGRSSNKAHARMRTRTLLIMTIALLIINGMIHCSCSRSCSVHCVRVESGQALK